jgi:hypothetical protein
MAKRVFLHVGTPKSGTTYLQTILWENLDRLKDNGFLLPARFKAHYAAAKGVTDRTTLKFDVGFKIGTAWPRLTKQINRWDGDAAISHELLAPATAEQANAAKALLDGAETHLVITARALNKQLSASWQEQVKGGMYHPFSEFLTIIESTATAKGEWFWDVQDVPAIASRWSDGIPPERVHIVTVPAEQSDPGQLWQRYCTALGLQADDYDADIPAMNASLGPVEAEMLRRIHARRDPRFTDAQRQRWTRRLLATEILGERRGAGMSGPASDPWLQERAQAMVEEIDQRGYDVIGSLDDLAWRPPSPESRSIESVTEAELDALTRWTIGRLQEQLVERQPSAPPPPVGPDDGIEGILELLEHIRAADTDVEPREAPVSRTSPTDRLRKSITALRGR